MKTIIIGLGNLTLGDDGVGIEIARRIRKKVRTKPNLEIKEMSVGGLGLLENIVGFDRAIIIDSITLPGGSAGRLHKLSPEDFQGRRGLLSGHQVGFFEAIEFGRKVNLKVPGDISIYAVEIERADTFSEKFSEEIEKRIPEIVEEIVRGEFKRRK